ncbi:hypothetical protein PF005_g23373 [Phytophthora fragariae]|uniref:RxLR effector protein n=1 Tax=Phytophthora fragariae TaxID=53985 RepID=A0A6A3WAF4_9STRA|nr:hypothetical protein PF005_g23373 [Phytophthora fragariae]
MFPWAMSTYRILVVLTLGLLPCRSAAACASLRAPLWRSAPGMVPRNPPRAVLFKVTCRKWKFCMCATRKYRGTGSVLVR